ncbi:MAG: methylenetetrahydrofolate reductase C-terminal domain-containing protein [Sedimentisphaerales bacterium]|nr:methylenetetrahydrofolate reductase C-terminal domain-containing protein [Sedimentisphaerales bacterium]
MVELVGGPGFNFGPIEKFLKAYKSAADFLMPTGFEFVGLMSPQNPGGVANLEPADVLAYTKIGGLLGDLDFIPHISCKDHNVDGIISSLVGFRSMGVDSVLSLTGDKPGKAQGVFEVESVGLLRLISDINNEQYLKAQPGKLDRVHQFFAGAAVSPFKYTEPSLMQQYYKMEKKVASGARYLITQVGWDWKKSAELFKYMKERNINVPVIGNVYLLSTISPAPRLMHDIKLPGCFVSDALFEKVGSESVKEHIERAAQQVAMYKALGAAGVDIGGVHDFEMFKTIMKRAAEIGNGWEQYKENLCWPADKAFYLYNEQGRRVPLSQPGKKFSQKFFNCMHGVLLDPEHKGFYAFKGLLAMTGVDNGKGAMYKTFNAFEKGFKYLAFDCEECGDCFLPENFSLCTIGGCEKGLDNVPCGDATAEGYCGNNLERVCIGELVYNAAAAEKDGREKLRIPLAGRNPALAHTSSIVNYLFGKDHTVKSPLIGIGESVHGSIPKTGAIMKELHAFGKDAFIKESSPLNYVRSLIESQANEEAAYIAVNLDAFGEDDPQVAVDLMKEYVKLVRTWGKGVPVCIDSSNDNVLKAGLQEWYTTTEKVKPPLVNSVKIHTMSTIYPLRKQYDFSFIGLLVTEDKATGPGGSHSVDELYGLARKLFDEAMKYGFKSSEIFFDSTVFPLAIDMPMEPGVPGYTYRAFETIKKVKSDPRMKGVHFSLGVSNSVRDLPARKIGVCRAYVATAMKYGLDAGIVNTAHRYGLTPPDADMLELVDAYAKMDGSPEKMMKAMELMGRFCSENRKASV